MCAARKPPGPTIVAAPTNGEEERCAPVRKANAAEISRPPCSLGNESRFFQRKLDNSVARALAFAASSRPRCKREEELIRRSARDAIGPPSDRAGRSTAT